MRELETVDPGRNLPGKFCRQKWQTACARKEQGIAGGEALLAQFPSRSSEVSLFEARFFGSANGNFVAEMAEKGCPILSRNDVFLSPLNVSPNRYDHRNSESY